MTKSVLSTFQRTAYAAAVFTVVWSLAIFLRRTGDSAPFSIFPAAFQTIHPNAALGMLLCGTALWLQICEPLTDLRRRLARVCGTAACLLAVATLGEYLFSVDLGMDRWSLFVPDMTAESGSRRLAPPTAIAILMLGMALLRIDGAPGSRHDPAQYSALIGGTIGGVAVVGYLYGVQSLYQVGAFPSISASTACLLAAIGWGILCARPGQGFMATLASEDLGGLMLRRILPFAIGLPILAGWIRITAQRSGLYGFNFGVALAVAAVLLIMLAVLWVLAGTLNRTDGHKKHFLQILQQREARHRLALHAGRMGTFHHDLDGHTLMWSPELEAIFGLPAMSFGSTFAAFQDLIHQDDRPGVERIIREAIDNRSAYNVECRILRVIPAGEAWVAITGQVLPDASGRPRQITGVMFDITDRKRSETALRQSEAQLRVITDALPGFIAYVDRDERYQFTNAGYERHFNLPRERITGQSVADLMKQDYHHVQRYLRRALDGEQVSFETTSLGQAGEETFFATYVPDRTADGTVAGLYILVTNITQHKRIEQALRESEGRFRHLFEQASDGILMADMMGHYLDINSRGCQMLGYTRVELLDMRVTDLLAPQDYQRLKDIKAELLEGHRHSGEWTLRRKDGGSISVEVSAKLQPDRRWHAIVRDITERKRAEAGMRESEAHFRMLADATPVLVCMAGLDTSCTWLNKSWLDYTGRTMDDELGRGWTSGIHSDDVSGCLEIYASHFDRREPFAMEYRLRKFDHTYGWILHRGVPLFTADGTFTGYLHASIDITDRKQTEAHLQEWTVQLEQRVHERTQALLRSQERLRALASDLSATEQQERRRLATELHDYLAQLLVVGRMKLGQAKPRVTDPAIQKLLDEADEVLTQSLNYTRFLVAELSPQVLYQFGLPAALKWLGSQMKTHGLTVAVQCEIDHLSLAEDRAVILYQSIRELLFNVVKHACTDTATISLVREGEKTVRITVTDRGCGFNPTVTTESDRYHPGRFGLFNVQERIEAVGGHVDLTSAEGAGTSITLTAPLTAETPSVPVPAAKDENDHESSAVSSSPRLRILLVDDHAMVRQGLRSVLESYQDLEVVGEAGDGESAVRLADTLTPEVVVMDINMPKVDGIEATRRIVARHPDIIVIGLSVQNERHIEEVMVRAGAAVFVTKERAAVQLYEAIISSVRARA
ncbi:MAG: PAS domain S-box protein [Nitrospira sp.]|nr:PAS domain S-box protein [Nitrospira sp.]